MLKCINQSWILVQLECWIVTSKIGQRLRLVYSVLCQINFKNYASSYVVCNPYSMEWSFEVNLRLCPNTRALETSRLHFQSLYGRKKSTTVIILVLNHYDSDIQCTPACICKIRWSPTHNTLYALIIDLHVLWCGHKLLYPHHTLPITP